MHSRYLLYSFILFSAVFLDSRLARHYGWYSAFWYTDVTMHIVSGVAFGLLWLWMIRDISSKWITFLSIITFAVFGSVLWEFWEFAGWHLHPEVARFYTPDLKDTLKDIFCGLLGGAILATIKVIKSNQEKRRT